MENDVKDVPIEMKVGCAIGFCLGMVAGIIVTALFFAFVSQSQQPQDKEAPVEYRDRR